MLRSSDKPGPAASALGRRSPQGGRVAALGLRRVGAPPACPRAAPRRLRMLSAQGWITGGDTVWHGIVTIPPACISGYLIYRLMFITFDIFYNDLSFLYKLKLFRACTIPGYYLTYRRKWLRTVARDSALSEATRDWERGFMQFFSLQCEKDLLHWCRIRQLLIDSSVGFKNIQRDVIFTYMLLADTLLIVFLFGKHYGAIFGPGGSESAALSKDQRQISAMDMWAIGHCVVFSVCPRPAPGRHARGQRCVE